MTKNRYEVMGVRLEDEKEFYGKCISTDIVSAIQLFRDAGFSPRTVQSRKQVSADMKIGIESVSSYTYDKYGLYKRIMKRDITAIGDIHTLEEAREIISMMSGNAYLNGELFQFENEEMQEDLKKYRDKNLNDISQV